MLKLGIITATRAEYGLLRRLIDLAQQDPDIELRLYITGTHLSRSHGYTLDAILADGFTPYETLPILQDGDDALAINLTCAEALRSFAVSFAEDPPDALLYLGDRYEILPIAQAALNARIPTIHLCGGETSEGAVDELVRHALTKLSVLHFPEAEPYRERILQMGEDPACVFFCGSPGVENVMTLPDVDVSNYPFDIQKPFFLITFHPETLGGPEESLRQQAALLEALEERSEQLIFTGVNADEGGARLQRQLEIWAAENPNVYLYDSLGAARYLTLMRRTLAVVGNSSSGIIEAPAAGVPTINIGDRQKGRLMGASVLDVPAEAGAIRVALDQAVDPIWRDSIKDLPNPYYKPNASLRILEKIKEVFRSGPPSLQKHFHVYPPEAREEPF